MLTDLTGTPLQLTQTGTTITGCYGDTRIIGTVNGAIGRAIGEDPVRRRPNAFILVADDDGAIHASVSVNNGRFEARTAVVNPDVAATPCAETPPEPIVCGASVYVNFDVDSAVVRPESEQVLADLFDQLIAEQAGRVVVAGHTSTEGADEYNQALSERRAQAVVDDLLLKGFDAAIISAVGKGETEPLISPDRNESARTLNRRVEISCG